MIKIQIKHYLTGSVLFEYEDIDNTLVKTVNEANLREADLREANLREADLREADLYEANLYGANLREADLYGADLRRADLREADLYGADLRGADLRRAKNGDLAVAMTRILPEGSIYGYKRCANGVIVKLRIPAKAKRSHAFGRKCRAEYAKVVDIYGADEAHSTHDPSFVYRKGEIVRPTKPFDENWTDECSTGIHFFITRLEAENYL
ncbi:pentapeptide repeat-containing protein [Mycolicibacterium porcinum]|uniref:pentapeptide repeat-containing protein n=1 Tax=Mycolicibacterium porcinum TaxID=39693 RepID=UPI00084861AF|nr:pentapeptide repeat-containing protein [Mycolicibacterium porcinum]ODR25798.1 hypothetical protein BHQ19_10225 [Mycolicibacterium porcinum]